MQRNRNTTAVIPATTTLTMITTTTTTFTGSLVEANLAQMVQGTINSHYQHWPRHSLQVKVSSFSFAMLHIYLNFLLQNPTLNLKSTYLLRGRIAYEGNYNRKGYCWSYTGTETGVFWPCDSFEVQQISTYTLHHGYTHGHRARERLRKKWMDNIMGDCPELDTPTDEAPHLAAVDRTRWRCIVRNTGCQRAETSSTK